MWLDPSCVEPPGVVNKVWLISINTPGKLTRVFLFRSCTVDGSWCRCCSVGPPSLSPSPLNWEGEGERAGSCGDRMITLHRRKKNDRTPGSNCHCCLYFWLGMEKYVLNVLENNKNTNDTFLKKQLLDQNNCTSSKNWSFNGISSQKEVWYSFIIGIGVLPVAPLIKSLSGKSYFFHFFFHQDMDSSVKTG